MIFIALMAIAILCSACAALSVWLLVPRLADMMTTLVAIMAVSLVWTFAGIHVGLTLFLWWAGAVKCVSR
jgi:flagellar motor component MotA